MNTPLRIRRIQIYPLAVPMWLRFEHAASSRAVADPVVVKLSAETPYNDYVGYGETLARRYVTGETIDTVVDDITEHFIPRLLDFRPTSFAEAVEFADHLPILIGGRLVNAARCAVELALLDLAGRVYRRRLCDVAGWMDQTGFGPPGCLPEVRYSGMVVGRTPLKLKMMLRLQRLYGLRDFKLKVAIEGWEQRLDWAYSALAKDLRRGRVTLRVDANGGWEPAQVREACHVLERHGVCALEQPLSTSDDGRLPALAKETTCDLIVDESLLTIEDAEELISAGGIRIFNVRIAKNGGLLPALRIARRALSAGLDVQLGCLVGETSLLTAAGAAFLEICPRVRFVEGGFGGFLLRGDITERPLRFRYGGKIHSPNSHGLGIRVSEPALHRYTIDEPRPINL